jgi:hypothetical protein
MSDALMQSFLEAFKDKPLLKFCDLANFCNCEESVINNWTRRNDPARRPPIFYVGREPRFPREDILSWLIEEQRRRNEAN